MLPPLPGHRDPPGRLGLPERKDPLGQLGLLGLSGLKG